MSETSGRPDDLVTKSATRYEARSKVMGRARFASDITVSQPLHAYLLTSGIARGSIRSISTAKARAVRGVVEIFTHENAPKRKVVPYVTKGGLASDTFLPLADGEIHFDGFIIAMVVAETFEIAREAAHRIEVDYAARQATATIDSPGAEIIPATKLLPWHHDKAIGDFGAGYAAADVRVDAEYRTPAQHHNALELFSTTAFWDDDELTLYEPSQYVYLLQNGVAEQLGIDPAKVHIVNPVVGGAFGAKGLLTQRTALVAAAARLLRRPVKLVATRDQGFTISTYRPETRHHVRLGAASDGKLTAYGHEGWELTSRADDNCNPGTIYTSEIYAAPNIWTKVNLVRADRNTPGAMRAPFEMPYVFALESAMDELAAALKMDPIELRRINDTDVSPINGVPYTSRSLMQCYDAAAARFGWSKRVPQPGAMRDGDWLIGYGCASALYPTLMSPATARVRLSAQGKATVQVATHELGQGAYSAMQQIAAAELGLPLSAVTVELGDSRLPPGPVSGGSMTTASVGSAVHLACGKVAARFGGAMPAMDAMPAAFARIGTTLVEEYAEFLPSGYDAASVQAIYQGKLVGAAHDPKTKPPVFAMGAHCVEVRVHRLTREIRVARMTGAFAGGRIVSPRTAHSQYMGGMVWGMASALLEATEIDEKRGRYVNDNIAEYLIAVNADIPDIDIIMVPEVDATVNPLGVKGIGELANVGLAAAIANGVYHATGKRIRSLPVSIDQLI